jgi:hypothetical protein
MRKLDVFMLVVMITVLLTLSVFLFFSMTHKDTDEMLDISHYMYVERGDHGLITWWELEHTKMYSKVYIIEGEYNMVYFYFYDIDDKIRAYGIKHVVPCLEE